MKHKKVKSLMLIATVSITMSGCYYDIVDEMHPQVASCDTTGTVSYANDISPIMLHSCGSSDVGCHNGPASQSGYGLGNYTDLIVTINDAGDFLQTITHDPSISASLWMPKGSSSKIDDCSIQKITAWYNRGKLDN